MTKRETYRSFHDLDTGRFRKDNDGVSPEKPRAVSGKPLAATGKKPPAPDEEDEAALFLEAVSGNMDVSMKHSHDVPAARPPRSGGAKPDPDSTAEKTVPEPVKPPVPKPAPEETRLFANAMDGVRPLRARGRDLAPPVRALPSVNKAALAEMEDVFSGKLEFSLEHTDEFVQGYVRGLDPVVLGKLKAGAYSPEAHVDLHGQNMEQAYATLATFIKNAYQNGKRHLIVVTGRGRNSPGGTPILRERVQIWFTRDPFKRVVLGFCSAKPGDGGAGALYLLLRKRKKSQGKIVWDNKPTEEELLL